MRQFIVERWRGDRSFEECKGHETVHATSGTDAIELSNLWSDLSPELRGQFTIRSQSLDGLRAKYRHKDDNPNWSDIVEAMVLDRPEELEEQE